MKAVIIDYRGTILKNESSDMKEMFDRLCSNSTIHDPVRMEKWWFGNLREMERMHNDEAFRSEDDLCMDLLHKAEDDLGMRDNLTELHHLNQNRWMYGELFSDAVRFLAATKAPVWVLTDLGSEYVRINLKRKGLHIHGVISAEDARVHRPDRRLFEYAVNKIGVNPEDVYVVGDDYDLDLKGAEEAGFETILVDRKGTDSHTCRKIRSLEELSAFLR